jgi:hypothetical protein
MNEVKSLIIGVSLIAAGVWCFHHVIVDRAAQSTEKQMGEIVIAKTSDGSLPARWQSSIPAPAPSK